MHRCFAISSYEGELCGSLLNLQFSHRPQVNLPALLLCTFCRPRGNGTYRHQNKMESIPLTGMMSVSTQTRLFLANDVERLRVVGKIFSSCQSSCHTPMHRHTASRPRGGGARKHEGLRSTKRPRILGVSQKMLVTLESIYRFHSKGFMNIFFFKIQCGEMCHVDLSFIYMNKLNPKGSIIRTNMTEGALREKYPSSAYFHQLSVTNPCTVQKRLFIQPTTVDLL